MYELLSDFARRPEPFSRYTAKALWTRPHLARQMLHYHLDQSTDLASRRFDGIDAVVSWLDRQLGLAGKSICDLGCGPGLYAKRFARLGARVTGVDFSAHSIAYARQHDEFGVSYQVADYLTDPLPSGFDLVTLIYTDFSVLSPRQRHQLLGRIKGMLKPAGRLVFDVSSTAVFADRQEVTLLEERLMGGFWAPGEYVGLQRTCLYPESRLVLDRYLIVEPNESWEIFNWFQHFTPGEVEAELEAAGFAMEQLVGDLSGGPLTPDSPCAGIIASSR